MTTQVRRKGVAVASRYAKTSRSVLVGSALSGLAAALIWAPAALADPPAPEPAPVPELGLDTSEPAAPEPAALAEPAPAGPDPALPAPSDPAPDAPVETLVLETEPAATTGVPHLPSPENLPPGTTTEPTAAQPGRGLAYLRDLWHAMRTQEVSMDDALLLLTQRTLDANATPPPGMSAGPQSSRPATAARPPATDTLQMADPVDNEPPGAPAPNPARTPNSGAPSSEPGASAPTGSDRPASDSPARPATQAPSTAPSTQPASPTDNGATAKTGPDSGSDSDSGTP